VAGRKIVFGNKLLNGLGEGGRGGDVKLDAAALDFSHAETHGIEKFDWVRSGFSMVQKR
jgi:hypothetical protein